MLVLAAVGPVLTRFVEPLLARRRPRPAPARGL
jgi:hypothetical protein